MFLAPTLHTNKHIKTPSGFQKENNDFQRFCLFTPTGNNKGVMLHLHYKFPVLNALLIGGWWWEEMTDFASMALIGCR